MSFYISKSKYCNAVQCPKMLWLSHYKPELFDASVLPQAILQQGSEVGDLAMGLFGQFVEVPFADPGEMVETTNALLEKGEKIIAEASFSYEGQFCSVDILVNKGNGNVEIYEVKSSTQVHPIYIDDVSYQTYVLIRCGFHVSRVCLVHINSKYVRHGDIELYKLFTIEDLTQMAYSKYHEVEERLINLSSYMKQTEEPSTEISKSCFEPYHCGFWKYCSSRYPHPNVFDLADIQITTMFNLFSKGVITFEDIEAYGKLNPKALQQVRHELHNQDDEINVPEVKKFMETLSYPLYFLDFETFAAAVPPYDNSKPYEQISFQYSLHYIETEGGELRHKEYLAYPGGDPRRGVALRLCEDIPDDVCVLAYNMSFEKTRIQSLAQLYPDLSAHLMKIHDNIKDLMVPFKQKHYYNRRMRGSYSIKYVLPALFPDDPALDYHNLEGVHNGSEASNAFLRMASLGPEEMETERRNLLKYCELDTFAMVKIWKKLSELE